MAHNRGEELKNSIRFFSHLLLGVKFLKFFLFLYSFLSFVFWFLSCFELSWLYLFNWLFIVPYKLVMIIYRPTGLSADFSLAIIGIISLVLGLLCEVSTGGIYQKISNLQESYEKYLQKRKQRKKRVVKPQQINTGLDDGIGLQVKEDENALLLFIVHPNVQTIKKQKTDAELTFQEVELWQKRVNNSILENIKYSQPMQKGYYRKNLFLVYKDFNYVDDFIYYFRPTIESILIKFKKYGIDVKFNYVLSSITKISAIEKELDLMDTILSLNFEGMFILTNRFKQAYEQKPAQTYKMAIKGEYNLSKNLSISNIQPLFVFKNVIS